MKTITKISMMLLIGTTLLISQEFDSDTIKAFKKAGVDITKQEPTEKQIMLAQKYMMELRTKEDAQMKKEMDESAKLMKEAYKKAGVDFKNGQPSPEQMQVVREYMESSMFPIRKKEILEEVKDVKEAKKCLEKADTLSEANSCVPEEEKFDAWNENEKKSVLKDITEFVKAIPCVEKSENMGNLQQCFPED